MKNTQHQEHVPTWLLLLHFEAAKTAREAADLLSELTERGWNISKSPVHERLGL